MKSVTLSTDNNRSLNLQLTETVFERMRGLFGINIQEVDGLWIKPCNSVHTIAMKYKIDLIYLDRHQRIIKLVKSLSAWRLSMALSAHSVIELKQGSIDKLGLGLGQTLN